MGHKKAWVRALGAIALVLAGFWLAPRVLPGMGWGLDELNQVAGIASLAVAVATLALALWPTPGSKVDGEDQGDVVELDRVRTKGAVKGRVGPTPAKGGSRTRLRRIRAGGDVIGQQVHSPTEPPQ
ncbi:hypothetical protein DFP74_4206 [Nocardiopsis sp. Huas11]|uniref:hypothetical protein n=1 Tax=Nocardiopsis sp. Huas11 TaxID=2183912 RepID=UPI000F13344A|nr:hypothetical protein [Nocardiopsis sp. Huas11]RKS08498.1 hypothetical protein DFP74_4206 [Nocardiopsis sp. Huas11]